MVRRTKQAEPKQVRCAIYTRISVADEQRRNGFDSIDAQREACIAYIANRKSDGWVLLPTLYEDRNISGATWDRPALQRLLADVRAGTIDCIVVQRVDRLSRSLLDFAKLMEILNEADVAFVSTTQNFSTADAMGRLTLHMLMSFAEFERSMISERTRDKMHAARRKGRYVGGLPPMGFDVDPAGGGLVVNKEEAPRVCEIFRVYLLTDGLIPAARELNRRGWTTKRHVSRNGRTWGGRPWTKTVLHHLLRNYTVVGQVEFGGEIYTGEHDAIVSDKLWAQVQKKLKQNSRNGGSRQRNKFGALLRGLLHCSACGKAMTHAQSQRGTRRWRYYRCSSAEKMGAASCPTGSLPAAEIERFVVDEIRCVGLDEDVIAETLKAVREDGAAKIREADLRQALHSFDPVWNELTGVERAKVVHLLVDRVTYDREKGEVAITFRPTGIKALAGETP